MLQLLLAAPSSGSGKTTAACALLSALKARGLEPCAFKCGPDYIDPMFHRAVLGCPATIWTCFSPPRRPCDGCTPAARRAMAARCVRVPWAIMTALAA